MRDDVVALYVDRRGPYPGLVAEWYDEARDARTYAGPWPVVAHPPCGPWSTLRTLSRESTRDLAPLAVEQVQRWGGVLEHPRSSRLFEACGLPLPGELPDAHGGVTVEVDQCDWGHVARKRSLLYIVGVRSLGPLPAHRKPTHWCSGGGTGRGRTPKKKTRRVRIAQASTGASAAAGSSPPSERPAAASRPLQDARSLESSVLAAAQQLHAAAVVLRDDHDLTAIARVVDAAWLALSRRGRRRSEPSDSDALRAFDVIARGYLATRQNNEQWTDVRLPPRAYAGRGEALWSLRVLAYLILRARSTPLVSYWGETAIADRLLDAIAQEMTNLQLDADTLSAARVRLRDGLRRRLQLPATHVRALDRDKLVVLALTSVGVSSATAHNWIKGAHPVSEEWEEIINRAVSEVAAEAGRVATDEERDPEQALAIALHTADEVKRRQAERGVDGVL